MEGGGESGMNEWVEGGCCRLTVRLAGWTVNWLMLQSGWLSIRSLGVQCTDLGSTLGGGVWGGGGGVSEG